MIWRFDLRETLFKSVTRILLTFNIPSNGHENTRIFVDTLICNYLIIEIFKPT